jgi:nucleotide-binding universal stress UspA family protein
MKTILLPYHDEEAARSALSTAILVAKRFDSYLEGLLVMGEPHIAVSFGPGMTVPPEYLSLAAEEWRRFADGARKDFLKMTGNSGLPFRELETAGKGAAAGWREIEGRESEVIGAYGRLFDLIVIGRTKAGAAARWRESCETALFESGRPVLLASADAPKTIGKVVVIAWNGSTESARTIAFGMPLLLGAERVEVLSVEGHMVPGPSGSEVTSHLVRHGISANSRTFKADQRPAGEIILDEAGDLGADLVLKGAFTRSRLRQVVFGGTTQHILDFAMVPVLLAH